MRIHLRAVFCFTLALLCLPAVVPAEPDAPDDDFAARGFYAGLGVGAGLENFGGRYLDLNERFLGQLDVASPMFDVRAGYRFHPNLAAELMWQYYTGWDAFVASGNPRDTEITGWSLTANAKAFLTTSRVQPFVLVGAGLGSLGHESVLIHCERDGVHCSRSDHDSDKGFVMRFGGGIDVHLIENWRIGLEGAYVLTMAELEGMDWATVGLVLACAFH